jgi:hypothetical protein
VIVSSHCHSPNGLRIPTCRIFSSPQRHYRLHTYRTGQKGTLDDGLERRTRTPYAVVNPMQQPLFLGSGMQSSGARIRLQEIPSHSRFPRSVRMLLNKSHSLTSYRLPDSESATEAVRSTSHSLVPTDWGGVHFGRVMCKTSTYGASYGGRWHWARRHCDHRSLFEVRSLMLASGVDDLSTDCMTGTATKLSMLIRHTSTLMNS